MRERSRFLSKEKNGSESEETREMKRMKRKEMVGNHWRKMKRREHTWWVNYM